MMRRDKVPVAYERNRTSFGYTETSRGLIQHLDVIVDGYVLQAPVMLKPRDLSNNGAFLEPKINHDGRYLHMLPGGVIVVGRMA